MKKGEEFIGEEIFTTVGLFEYPTAEAALKAEVRKRVLEKFPKHKTLICSFSDVTAAGFVTDVYVGGKITLCEVS